MAKHVNEAMTSFGLQLAQLRKSAGFTQQELTEEDAKNKDTSPKPIALIHQEFHSFTKLNKLWSILECTPHSTKNVEQRPAIYAGKKII